MRPVPRAWDHYPRSYKPKREPTPLKKQPKKKKNVKKKNSLDGEPRQISVFCKKILKTDLGAGTVATAGARGQGAGGRGQGAKGRQKSFILFKLWVALKRAVVLNQ